MGRVDSDPIQGILDDADALSHALYVVESIGDDLGQNEPGTSHRDVDEAEETLRTTHLDPGEVAPALATIHQWREEFDIP